MLLHFFGVRHLFAGEGIFDGDGEGAGEELLHAEAHGGFVQELVGDGPGSFGGAVLGGEDVGVAERFLELGGDGSAVVAGVVAAEPVVHAVAPDGVEEGVHSGAVEGEELGHGADALGVEAEFGACADAGEVAENEVGDGVGELAGEEADEAVGLLHVAGDLGEVAVGRHADGAAEGVADIVLDGLFDVESDASGVGGLALAAEELAGHLVDAGGVGDGADALYRGNNFVRIFRVGGVVAVDEDDVRADALGVADAGSGLDAEGLGLVAGGDEGGGVGHGGDDAGGLVAELGMDLLFYRREEAVEVDVEEGEEVGLSSRAHRVITNYIRLNFATLRPTIAGFLCEVSMGGRGLGLALMVAVLGLASAPGQSAKDGSVRGDVYSNRYFKISLTLPPSLQAVNLASLNVQGTDGKKEYLMMAAREKNASSGIVLLAEKLEGARSPGADEQDFLQRVRKSWDEGEVFDGQEQRPGTNGLVFEELDYEIPKTEFDSAIVTRVGNYLLVFKCNAKSRADLKEMDDAVVAMHRE